MLVKAYVLYVVIHTVVYHMSCSLDDKQKVPLAAFVLAFFILYIFPLI